MAVDIEANPPIDEEEDCVTCVKPPKKEKQVPKETEPLLKKQDEEIVEEEAVVDRKGLIISFIILIGSIPALIGACCWPALVLGLITGGASAASRVVGHKVAFAVTLAMMIGLNAYMLHCAIKKRRTEKHRWGPFIFTLIAAPLICAEPSRHLLMDIGIWKPGPFPGASEYRPECGQETIRCLSLTGWLITFGCTYVGFIMLFIGTMWNAHMVTKLKQIKRKWRLIRKSYKKKKTVN